MAQVATHTVFHFIPPTTSRWDESTHALRKHGIFNGLIGRDLKLPVTSTLYLICLTSESAGDIRTRKIRAMIIRQDQLMNLSETTPQFESPHHITRWETLQRMKAAYEKDPHLFLEMELGV